MTDKENDFNILKDIFDKAQNTAPVLVQIGYTRNNTCMKGIVLKTAPAAIISMLYENGYICDLTEDGLHVYDMKF